jgi:hypothetical protein
MAEDMGPRNATGQVGLRKEMAREGSPVIEHSP